MNKEVRTRDVQKTEAVLGDVGAEETTLCSG